MSLSFSMLSIFFFFLLLSLIIVSSSLVFSASSFISPQNRLPIRILKNHPNLHHQVREARDSLRLYYEKQQQQQAQQGDTNVKSKHGDELDAIAEAMSQIPFSLSNLERLRQMKLQEYRNLGLDDQKENFKKFLDPYGLKEKQQHHKQTESLPHGNIQNAKYYFGSPSTSHNYADTPSSSSPSSSILFSPPQLIDKLVTNKAIVDKSVSELVLIKNEQIEGGATTSSSPFYSSSPSSGGYQSYNSHIHQSATNCREDEALRVDFTHDADGDGKLYGNTWGSGFVQVGPGDYYEYEIMWLTESCNCGAEIESGNDWRLRDHAALDARGYSPHSEYNENMTTVAYKKWYKRRWYIGDALIGSHVEKYLFSAFQKPGSKGSALFRNIRIIHRDNSTGEETIKKVIWQGGQSSPPAIQNHYFKGSFTTSCQSPSSMVDVERARWYNLPLRRAEKSRLSFQVNVLLDQQEEDDALQGRHADDEEEQQNEVLRAKEKKMCDKKYQNCPLKNDAEYVCCVIPEKNEKCFIETATNPSNDDVVMNSYFQSIESAHRRNTPSTKNEFSLVRNMIKHENQTSAFLQNWERIYSREEYNLVEHSVTLVLNWTARLRHSKHHEVTLWDLLADENGNENDERRDEHDHFHFEASNFSLKEVEEKLCRRSSSSSSSSCLNKILNLIIMFRQRELARLDDLRHKLLTEIARLQNLNEEEKKKNPNSVKEWTERNEEFQFSKMQSELAELDWDRYLIEALIMGNKIYHHHQMQFAFPFSESIDFDVPSDTKSLPFLKNILHKTNSELEVTISFIRIKLLITTARKGEAEEEVSTITKPVDVHIKEIRVSTSELLENDFKKET